ncbi:hypothetical protein MD484_g480, partial [Candolleomyces efflorescens]
MSTIIPPEEPLTYTIAASTPHSGSYSPENILVENPGEQRSRWSGAYQGNAKQWIILRLESPTKITFGKFNKPHPCNVKEFKVYVGLTEESMTQVIQSGLKNTTESETFDVRHTNKAGAAFPTRYVKIEPLSAHGQSFHVSIWHVALRGISEPTYVERIAATYEEHREVTVLRHTLKYLRQRRLLTPFQTILERSDIQLENPLVTRLHESIVLQGDWERAENLLHSISDAGLFTEYLHSCQPQAMWKRVTGSDADGDVPSPRGGHAMCMDAENQLIYLFGGWDGRKSLDDFWVYNVREDKWKVLSHSTRHEPNAPGPRSCHKMVFDSKTGNIYLLGRLDDADVRNPIARSNIPATAPPPFVVQSSTVAGPPFIMQSSPLRQQFTPTPSNTGTPVVPPAAPRTYCSEFYRYQTRGIDAGKWVFLSFDTAASGGPPLVFDHQMAMDSEAQILYNVRLSKWKLLQPSDVNTSSPVIPSRFGHSMVLEPKAKQLYIFGGQKDEKYLSDMYVYDISSNTSTELFSNFTNCGGPDPCFTQRAVIDPLMKEIYVFCGLTRNPAGSSKNTVLRSSPCNWIFRYDSKPGKWYQISRHPDSPPDEVPVPRFAHQAVYHAPTRTVFLHGGNAGGLSALERERSTSANRNPDGNTGSARPTPSPPDEGPQPLAQPNPSIATVPATIATGSTQAPDQRQGTETPPTEMRLDDFWMMKLRRPDEEEVIRQAKFHIRRQQFREMCEEDPPVKALQFLQNEVSNVVDHKNAEEAETFRSLLTHLLAPSSSHSALPLPHPIRRRLSDVSSEGSWHSPSSSPSPKVRRKSRGEHSDDGSETWTSQLPGEGDDDEDVEDDNVTEVSYPVRGTAETLRGIIDPLEITAAKKAAAAAAPAGGRGGADDLEFHEDRQQRAMLKPVSLSSERYDQRMDVFNSLIKVVAEGQKEPVGDLLDLVNQDAIEWVDS